MAHQPMAPSARDNVSIASNAISGESSGPPIERGRYICNSPASARAVATSAGTRRIRSALSRLARMSGTSCLAAITGSMGVFDCAFITGRHLFSSDLGVIDEAPSAGVGSAGDLRRIQVRREPTRGYSSIISCATYLPFPQKLPMTEQKSSRIRGGRPQAF